MFKAPAMSLRRSLRAQTLGTFHPPLAEKITEEPITNKTAQSTVTYAYQANIAGYWRIVTVLWCKNLMNHYLNIAIHSLEGDFHCTCKIDLKPWSFWSKKGYKPLQIDGNQVEIYWDVRTAKFITSPDPFSDYYVAIVSDDEIVLILGDYKKKAYKRTKSRPALVEAIPVYKKENVFAKKSFTTSAIFDERRKQHDIVVESSAAGMREPEMWISVDGIVVIHVKNLQWKFRGNQTVLVDNQPVQVLYDVHDWLFSSPGVGYGLFIFKPGAADPESDRDGSSSHDGCGSDESSLYHSARRSLSRSEFCLFLYAWKIE